MINKDDLLKILEDYSKEELFWMIADMSDRIGQTIEGVSNEQKLITEKMSKEEDLERNKLYSLELLEYAKQIVHFVFMMEPSFELVKRTNPDNLNFIEEVETIAKAMRQNGNK